jgi:Coenzyme PQQ synthesis protein D (PqqD)
MPPQPSRIEIPPRVLFRDLDGEAVLLQLDSGKYFGLNEMGTRIWELLARYGELEPVCRALLDEFEVPEDQLRREVRAFLDALAACRLVDLATPPEPLKDPEADAT